MELASFFNRFSSEVSSGSLGAVANSGVSAALVVGFLDLGFAVLAAESFTDLGVEAPFALGVVFNLMVVFGFLTESVFGESLFRQ